MIMKNHTSAPVRKEKLSPMTKARREASRNELMEKGGMPNRVESFRKVNRIARVLYLGLLNPSEMDRERYRI